MPKKYDDGFVPDAPVTMVSNDGFVPDKPIEKKKFVPKPIVDESFENKLFSTAGERKEPVKTAPVTDDGFVSDGFVPDKPVGDYKKFVNTLSRIQSGLRGIASEFVETGKAVAEGDLDREFNAIGRFKQSLKGEEYVTAADVFKEIPEGKNKSLTLNLLQNAPKEIAEVSLDFITDPTLFIMSVAGIPLKGAFKIISKLSKSSPVRQKVEAIANTDVGKKAKDWLIYRGNQPKSYQKAAEERILNIKKGTQEAGEIGMDLTKDLTRAEQQRLGQIVHGGESVSEREAPLRELAKRPMEKISALEKEAQQVSLKGEQTLLPEVTFKTKLTRAAINGLRNEKDKIFREIDDALGKTRLGRIKQVASNVSLKGIEGLRSKWVSMRNEIMAAKDESFTALERQLGTNIDDFLDRMINLAKVNKKVAVDNLERFAGRAMTLANKTGSGRMEQLSDAIFKVLVETRGKAGLASIAELTNKTRAGIAENLIKKTENINRGLKNTALDLAEGIDNVKIAGLRPLAKSLEGDIRFKGQAKLINQKLDRIAEIDKRIQTSYKHGGEKYVPRMYAEKEGEKKGLFGILKAMRVKGERFKARETTGQAGIYARGEIKEPAYPVAKGIAQVTHDIETAKLFNRVASNPEWVSNAERKGFVQMPEGKKLGNLSGKWVEESIASDINEITRIPKISEKIYKSFLMAWKYSKTVANPSTHFRNIYSNSILLDLSGIDPLQQMKLIPRAAKEMLSKGKYYKEAVNEGLLGTEFYGGEIGTFLENYKGLTNTDAISRVINPVKWAIHKGGKIYQAEEQIFKMAKYMAEREKGKGIQASIAEAEKYIFNYEKVPKIIKFLRQSPVGAPFITFASKAIPVTIKTALKNPAKVYKYVGLFKAIENQSQAHLGISDNELELIKRNFKGTGIVLPFKDAGGSYQVLDLSYILPWGDIGEQGGTMGLSPTITPSNPLFKGLAEIYTNKSTFTGKEIYNPRTDTTKEKFEKVATYLIRNSIPVPTYFPKGYTWDKIVNAIQKRPDYYDRMRGLPKVLLDVVAGVKISPVDIELILDKEKDTIESTIRELKTEAKYVVRHPGIDDKTKRMKIESNAQKIEHLLENKKSLNDWFRLLAGGL